MSLLNVRSLLNKTLIVNGLILDNNFDCLLLTETSLATMHHLFSLRPPLQIFTFYFLLENTRKVLGLHPFLATYLDQTQYYDINLFPSSPTPLFLVVSLSFGLLFIDLLSTH